ncbi:MAG: hypothetical protein DHS20C02_03700 [Micavibrio sp.]|nr:MAG: hypothetical protein DHS20C02_03700 [Micavibrio sp.]
MPHTKTLPLLIFFLFVLPTPLALAEEAVQTCPVEERQCVTTILQDSASHIKNPTWRDQTYRELAKTLAFDKRINEAIALIDKIESSDTKAMTIRGIGMTVADNKLNPEEATVVFNKLHEATKKIAHKPSFAIALTYISMSQAFAGDNDGAWATAAAMENEALRNKAYGEAAEIQAERKDFTAAMTSISKIASDAYKNKAYSNVSKILAGKGLLEEALQAGMKITNAYKKSQALQYVLDKQKPREVEKK